MNTTVFMYVKPNKQNRTASIIITMCPYARYSVEDNTWFEEMRGDCSKKSYCRQLMVISSLLNTRIHGFKFKW